MQGGFGPGDTSYLSTLQVNLIDFIRKSSEYVANLSEFDKYVIWRYTIGSASINSFLIFGRIKTLNDNSSYWCYLFFLYWKNTFGGSRESWILVPSSFKKYRKYFETPELFKSKIGVKEKDIEDIIKLYILRLQKIVIECPTPSGDISVFKVSSKYPGLPEKLTEIPTTVLQLPFNSTTIDPHFNFAPFVSPEASCCFFEIHIPKGQHCLFVPPYLHAYPFEKEIILPYGCIFEVFDKYEEDMNYIDVSDVNIVKLQSKRIFDSIVMGPVYEIDEYQPCYESRGCNIKKKHFEKYEAILKTV